MKESYQLVIAGGGPAGLTAGIYARRAGIECLVLERAVPGGTMFLAHKIENYPGFPNGISGQELSALMEEQAKKVGVEIEQAELKKLELEGDEKILYLPDTIKIKAKAVIIATGVKPKKLGIRGEEILTGRGVSYCATCDGAFFKNEKVAVIGGGNSALGEALYLSELASKVYLVHRRDEFRASKVLVERAKAKGNIEFLLERIPIELIGEQELRGLKLKKLKTNEEEVLDLSGVFIYVGIEPNNGAVSHLLNLSPAGFILAGEDCKTNVAGIFACGDIREKPIRQIVGAVSDGCNAVRSVEEYFAELRLR